MFRPNVRKHVKSDGTKIKFPCKEDTRFPELGKHRK